MSTTPQQPPLREPEPLDDTGRQYLSELQAWLKSRSQDDDVVNFDPDEVVTATTQEHGDIVRGGQPTMAIRDEVDWQDPAVRDAAAKLPITGPGCEGLGRG